MRHRSQGYIVLRAPSAVGEPVLETQGQLERFVHIVASLVAIGEAAQGRTGKLFFASLGAIVIMKVSP